MTTHSQLREPTKAQRKLARRQDKFDEWAKKNSDKVASGAVHRPGSVKK